MKLYFKQRLFSWFDSYDIYDYDTGDVVYTVEGQLAWRHIATVKQRVLTFLPKFDLYLGDACIGTICKEFTIVRPLFTLDFNGWQVEGDFMGWEYEITDGQRQVAAISKELLHWTDTYVIDVADGRDGLCALMVVLAIDAEKCSRNS